MTGFVLIKTERVHFKAYDRSCSSQIWLSPDSFGNSSYVEQLRFILQNYPWGGKFPTQENEKVLYTFTYIKFSMVIFSKYNLFNYINNSIYVLFIIIEGPILASDLKTLGICWFYIYSYKRRTLNQRTPIPCINGTR